MESIVQDKQQKCANWFGTLNNPGQDPRGVLEEMHKQGKATYTVGQLEKGAEGTEHL